MTARSLPLPVLLALGILALAALGEGYALYSAHASLAETTAKNAELSDSLASAQNDNKNLSDALSAEQARNQDFENQLEDLEGTVGKLDKLSRIDPELLEKYSKVFFLSENYIPAKLTQITQQYVSNTEDEYFLAQAWPDLREMIEDAAHDDVDLTVVSGYRSFEKQTELKGAYTVTYGTGANAFSADQGYSEHQLGTAVDFSTKQTAGALDGFDKTTAYAWLTKNAYKYGFILSYPAGNTYYQYEPWHWRFVGKKLADDLHDDKKNFYDLDQRDIDKYLISIFD